MGLHLGFSLPIWCPSPPEDHIGTCRVSVDSHGPPCIFLLVDENWLCNMLKQKTWIYFTHQWKQKFIDENTKKKRKNFNQNNIIYFRRKQLLKTPSIYIALTIISENKIQCLFNPNNSCTSTIYLFASQTSSSEHLANSIVFQDPTSLGNP